LVRNATAQLILPAPHIPTHTPAQPTPLHPCRVFTCVSPLAPPRRGERTLTGRVPSACHERRLVYVGGYEKVECCATAFIKPSCHLS
jgi:hypothetical protein